MERCVRWAKRIKVKKWVDKLGCVLPVGLAWISFRVHSIVVTVVVSVLFSVFFRASDRLLGSLAAHTVTFLAAHQCGSFFDYYFLVTLTEDVRNSVRVSSARVIVLLVGFAVWALTSKMSLIQLFWAVGAVIVSLVVAVGFKGRRSSVGFTLESLSLVSLLELLSHQCLRFSAVTCYGILAVHMKVEWFPKLIMTDEAKRLLSFLVLNFLFMFAEFWVGYWTNSLGLLADAFHMLCDNTSLFFSALAALVSHQEPTKMFTYGLRRIEIVCSLSNAILLLFVSFNLFSEAVTRLIDPPTIGDDHLMLVSVLGLFVNIAGLFFTGSGETVFLKSIFLHVLVDTCGSAAVIISSFCISHWNLYISDPICSLLIAVSIFFTSIPLTREVIDNLLLAAPDDNDLQNRLATCGHLTNFHIWMCGDTDSVATGRISAPTSDPQSLLSSISELLAQSNTKDATFEIITLL